MAINVGQGTILKMTISSSLTAIAQVVEISGPEVTVGKKEKTNLSDVAVRKRAQLPDGGTVSFTIQYDPADSTHTALTTAVNSWPQAAVVWNQIFNTVAGTDKAVYTAFITKFAPKGMNQEDNLEADLELEIDGVPTWS
jgi:hypothetical protein